MPKKCDVALNTGWACPHIDARRIIIFCPVFNEQCILAWENVE
jgi:hypothetical protein